MTIEALNQQYGIKDLAQFTAGEGGFVFLSIKNKSATARICLYGAQILSYTPHGQQDILWMSQQSHMSEGKAIRGGIPVCFPWFGPHAVDKTKPQHGFARITAWQVNHIQQLQDGATHIQLQLEHSDATLQLWPHSFKAVIDFVVGALLQVTVTVTNTGKESLAYSDALHTYFNVSNIDAIHLEGFDNSPYYEAFGTELTEQSITVLHPEIENNRRYIQHTGNVIINDPVFNRKIHIAKTGSKVTVLWNPGPIVTKNISDMEPNGYKNFICVEPANAYVGIDMIELAAGGQFGLSTTISVL